MCNETGSMKVFGQVVPHDDPDFMMHAIRKYSPASFTIWGDMSVLQHYQSGVISSCGSVENGGHAMQITGWDSSMFGAPVWIVRNSWGTAFGYDGYMYFEAADNTCGINDYAFVGLGNK